MFSGGSGGGFGVAWGGGLGVLGKFLVIWKDFEGFGGILKGGMISGDFYRFLTPLVSIGMVFYFSKSGNALPCW